MTNSPLINTTFAALTMAAISFPASVVAQEQQTAKNVLLEEVVVTARKREESIMDVPVAVSAFNADQLDALRVRDIQSLSVSMPNVALDDIGTTRGAANFSIRGLGINSSIPSIDPTVGTFIDGVYMGTNQGVVFDVFDLESIEVLRGPQGTLFGRNVTGGAVLLNSRKPSQEFEGKIKASYELGGEKPNKYLMASVGGPISETFAAKVSVYTNQDDGYFKNLNDGQAIGKQDTVAVRPMVVWTPNDQLSLTAIYDHFDSKGDGTTSQNHVNGLGISNQQTNFDRNSLDLSIDNRGGQDTKSGFFRTTIDYDLDNGRITNVFGHRNFNGVNSFDVDSTPLRLFDSGTEIEADQVSNELRYTGDLSERIKITTGVYYFKNQILYAEGRQLLGLLAPPGKYALTQDGGGDYEVKTKGAFASLDYTVSELLSINFGLRYTDETKKVKIATLSRNVNSPCNVIENTCVFDFSDQNSWSNLSPKIGFNYNVGERGLAYGYYAKGFRSGGYNLRNTARDTVKFGPGPFNEETVNTFELGYKTQFANGGRVTAAIFHNQIDDMQREVNLADSTSGVLQVIRNTADAKIKGIEVDTLFPLTDNLLLNASFGYIDPSYDRVSFDLNGDGVVNEADKNLDLPRAAKLTYAVGLTLDNEVGDWGTATSRLTYSHRDQSAYTDNNLGFINKQDIIDATIDFRSDDGRWSFGIYGKNLGNEVKHGGDTQLPAKLGPIPLGGTLAPLAKGRIYGVEVTYNF